MSSVVPLAIAQWMVVIFLGLGGGSPGLPHPQTGATFVGRSPPDPSVALNPLMRQSGQNPKETDLKEHSPFLVTKITHSGLLSFPFPLLTSVSMHCIASMGPEVLILDLEDQV